LTLHAVLILVLALIAAVFIFMASREPIGPTFAIYILVAAIAFVPLPFLAYRLFALNRADYSLDRDKLTITWGLRLEQIPISDVEWVRPMQSMAAPLALPLLRLPGSILGLRRHPDLGPIEFLASDASLLLLVATTKRVFVISPQDSNTFMQNIQRAIEMGSLSPSGSQSIYPAFVVVEAWESLLVRYLWLADMFLNIGLLLWVSLTIPDLKEVSLGFLPTGAAGTLSPAVGLILLPIASILCSFAGWIAGLFFYRRADQRPLAHIVWASGVFASLLFLLAVMFIVITPV
jgi:hypothetical protein